MRIGYSFTACLVVALVALSSAKTDSNNEVLNHHPMLRGQKPAPMLNQRSPQRVANHIGNMPQKHPHVDADRIRPEEIRPMMQGPPREIHARSIEHKVHAAFLQPELNPIRTLDEMSGPEDGRRPRGPPPRRAPPSDGENNENPPDGTRPRGPPPRREPPGDAGNTEDPVDGSRPRGSPPRRAPPSDGDNGEEPGSRPRGPPRHVPPEDGETSDPADGTRPHGPPPRGPPPSDGGNGEGPADGRPRGPPPVASAAAQQHFVQHHAMMRGGSSPAATGTAASAENQVPKLLESYRLAEEPAAAAAPAGVETPELAAVSGLAQEDATAVATENKVPLIVPGGSIVAPQELAIFVPKEEIAAVDSLPAAAAAAAAAAATNHRIPAAAPASVPAAAPVFTPTSHSSSSRTSSEHHHHQHPKTKRESARQHAAQQEEHIHSPKKHISGHMDKETGQYKSFKENYGTKKTFKQ